LNSAREWEVMKITHHLGMVNKMLLKNENILTLGMMSLSLAILVGRFIHYEVSGFSISDFTEGVLTGLSLMLYLIFLMRVRKTNAGFQ
jgi:hypothetical protein